MQSQGNKAQNQINRHWQYDYECSQYVKYMANKARRRLDKCIIEEWLEETNERPTTTETV